MEGNDPVVIANAGRCTHHTVGGWFSKNLASGSLVRLAKRQAVTNSQNTVFSIKRFMGRFHNEVNEEMKLVPYKSRSR